MAGFWKDTQHRLRRLWNSQISKKWLVFYIATVLLWHGKIDGTVWAGIVLIVIGASTHEKISGVPPDLPRE